MHAKAWAFSTVEQNPSVVLLSGCDGDAGREVKAMNKMSIMHNVHCALCNVHCAMCIVQCALCNVHCALCNVQCALCIVQCTLCNSIDAGRSPLSVQTGWASKSFSFLHKSSKISEMTSNSHMRGHAWGRGLRCWCKYLGCKSISYQNWTGT